MNKHAKLMKLYAQDWAYSVRPWLGWEILDQEKHEWGPLTQHPNWSESDEYRRKPVLKTIQLPLSTTNSEEVAGALLKLALVSRQGIVEMYTIAEFRVMEEAVYAYTNLVKELQ